MRCSTGYHTSLLVLLIGSETLLGISEDVVLRLRVSLPLRYDWDRYTIRCEWVQRRLSQRTLEARFSTQPSLLYCQHTVHLKCIAHSSLFLLLRSSVHS